MNDDSIDTVKDTLLRCIHELIEVAEREHRTRTTSKLRAQQHLLEGLDERIERSQLPNGFVRSVMNDIRLELFMIHADLKLLSILKKQEAAAPTAKLKQQARDRFAEYRGEDPESVEISGTSDASELPEIELTLHNLKNIEQRPNECLL